MAPDTKEEDLNGFDPSKIYTGTPLGAPGEGDLIVGAITREVIGRATIFLQLAGGPDDIRPRFRGTTIVVPPISAWDISEDDILEYVEIAIRDLRGEPASPEELEYINKSVTITRCDSFTLSSLINVVSTAEDQLIIIVEAAKYRDPDLRLDIKIGQSVSWVAEDEWVPHMAKLASICLNIAAKSGSYIVFIASDSSPVDPKNEAILNAVDGLYPVFFRYNNEPGELLRDRSKAWLAMILEGGIEDVLSEIAATTIHADLKTQLAIQLIARSGDDQRAARLIREELAKGMSHPPDVVLRFARLAEKSGDRLTGNELRQRAITSVNERHLLEEALVSATDLDNAAIIAAAFSRLNELFPTSTILAENRELRLLRCCQMTVAREHLEVYCAGFSERDKFLVQSLYEQHGVEYSEILKKISTTWPSESNFAAYCCAIHAQAEELPFDAIAMALQVSEEPRYARLATSIILSAVRRMMLRNIVPRDEFEFYKLPLRYAIGYLANHPNDASTRNLLTSLLSVETCGAIGLPLIASLALDVMAEGASVSEPPVSASPPVTKEEFENFFPAVLDWMQAEQLIELGVSQIPSHLVGKNPQGLIAFLVNLIRHAVSIRDEDADLPFLDKCVHVVCLLAPHADDYESDLEMLRLLASRYSLEGHHQKARDLAEQILILAEDNPQRHRLAWTAFGDIYQRTRSPIEALTALSCAAATHAPVGLASLWHEAFALLRITRDLGLYDIAMRLHSTCKELSDRLKFGKQGDLRLTTIELGLRFIQSSEANATYLSQLLVDLTKHCEQIIDDDDELMPVASLLGQLVSKCQSAGIPIDDDCNALLQKALVKLGPRMGSFLQTIASTTPTSEDVLALLHRGSTARYSEDTATDMTTIVMAARRLLRSSAVKASVQDVCFSLELLAEKSIDTLGESSPIKVDWAAEYIAQLASQNVAVVLTGLTDTGDLVTAVAKDSEIKIQSSAGRKETFARILDRWTVDYPYKYGLIDREEGNNEFYVSMEELAIPLPQTKNILIIPDPSLQQVPMNLILIEREFIGKTCAVGTAPSLGWLNAVHNTPRQHDGRRLAWISASDDPDEFGTLEAILGRMYPTLDQFGFRTDTARKIPSDFGGAQMAVVTAHGSLTKEARFIQRISDEGNLAESPIALARALAGVEVVILFVCSGGRLDRHPHSNTTVGLPKLLLDRGSRVVIASPWPLAALVTYRWLESFMIAWEAGETVLDATFKANANVALVLGDPPQYGLAMVVHGDVFLRKS